MKYCYAVTITPNKRDKVYYAEDIDAVSNKLLSHTGGYIHPFIKTYEIKTDSKGQGKILHCHTMLFTDKSLRYKTIQKKFPGWQLYFQQKYSDNWDAYCTKNAANVYLQEQILTTHFYRHNHMFVKDTPPPVKD